MRFGSLFSNHSIKVIWWSGCSRGASAPDATSQQTIASSRTIDMRLAIVVSALFGEPAPYRRPQHRGRGGAVRCRRHWSVQSSSHSHQGARSQIEVWRHLAGNIHCSSPPFRDGINRATRRKARGATNRLNTGRVAFGSLLHRECNVVGTVAMVRGRRTM